MYEDSQRRRSRQHGTAEIGCFRGGASRVARGEALAGARGSTVRFVTSSEPFGAAAEFKLSITRALADQLAERLTPLRAAPLNEASLGRVQSRPGIYELFLGERRVYIGKASKSLPDRLRNHLRKLSGRTGLSLAVVNFVCLYVDEDLEAAAPETLLLKKYRTAGGLPWNTNGFGNKDPGRRRDTSDVAADHFDAQYPINLDATVELAPRVDRVDQVLAEMKKQLPYNLRYERTSSDARRDLQVTVNIEQPVESLRALARLVLAALPPGWQLTALPGYAILYKETASYDTALAWWRSTTTTGVLETTGPARVAAPAGEQLNPSDGAETEDDPDVEDDVD